MPDKSYKKKKLHFKTEKEDALFEELAPAPRRYQMEVKEKRPWTPQEDRVLFATLISCGHDGCHKRTALKLCTKILNRVPQYVPGAKPTTKTHMDNCKDLLECRIWAIGADRTLALASCLPGHPRVGLPITWGEEELFLKPYVRRLKTGQSLVDLATLGKLLGRKGDAEIGPRVKLIHAFPNHQADPDYSKDPSENDAFERAAVEYLRAEDEDDEKRMLANLLQTLGIQ